ncbi:DNA mismatch endonuclease Vsr [Rhizobium leguminosarum]|uniref:very short patch repair endonuclease n=1 Tax=Rhizobium leguminosarum TaxID=384 RepID=UPI001C97C8EF|nr:very short patch repair endonuclease [Rhizobium leguminosarum]MBY5473593.1 DNA mismatch endonuclease Vsr [Rhizobium leguminosarum]
MVSFLGDLSLCEPLVSERRSRNMRAVRGNNTKPEIAVRKLLHSLGYRFRLQRADLPGKPDIVLPRHKLVVFVHGCFWHRHDCKRASMPKTRTEFWKKKLSANVERDVRVVRELAALGWKVVVIWECEVASLDLVGARVVEAATDRSQLVSST